MITSCREVQNLLGLFFDSELDSRQMRAVALHSATCRPCEEELRRLEHLQELVARSVADQVDAIDLSRVWANVESRLKPRHISWVERAREWWSEREWGWGIPAMGAAAAAAALVGALVLPSEQAGQMAAAEADNAVSVHEISSDSHIALVGEADTLLVWVDHELAGDAAITGEPVNFEAFE